MLVNGDCKGSGKGILKKMVGFMNRFLELNMKIDSELVNLFFLTQLWFFLVIYCGSLWIYTFERLIYSQRGSELL